MQSIEELMSEHETVRRVLGILSHTADQLEAGIAVDASDLADLTQVLQVFVERNHQAKEERRLFVTIEAAGLHEYRDTISALIRDHGEARQHVGDMNMAAWNYGKGKAGAGAEYAAAARRYVALMSDHLDREEREVFAVAEAHLTPADDQALSNVFGHMNAHEMGPDRAAALEAILSRMEVAYPA